MIHRHIRTCAIPLLFAGVFSSCKKEFLDDRLLGQSTVQTNPDLAADLVTGAYNTLMISDTWGPPGDIHGFAFIGATNIMSDDADKGSYSTDQSAMNEFENFTLTPTNLFVNSLWKGYFTGIARINNAMQFLEQATTVSRQTKEGWIGELRFLRAYYYFNLVRFFGDVPKVVRVASSPQDAYADSNFVTRTARRVIYDSVIIPDLMSAARNTLAADRAEPGRVTRGATHALLSKVHLYLENWQQAYAYSDSVIRSGHYALLGDYASLYRDKSWGNSEAVFQVQTGNFNSNNFGLQNYTLCQGPRVGGKGGWNDLGWGFCTPTPSLINSYEAGDVRRNATVIFIDNSGQYRGTFLWDGYRIPSKDSVENLYYNYKAYASIAAGRYANPDDKDRNKNLYLLRYADILLIHAEAANEIGQSDRARTLLNQVRSRAKLQATQASGKNDLRTAIWEERHWELALEHDRFFDLVRQRRAAQVFRALGKNFIQNKHELLPVPAVQIALANGKLTQNNGY
jgi:hypothetical protein